MRHKQTEFISPYQTQVRRHYFFRYCEEDIGGCGVKFQPTGPQQHLCVKCRAKCSKRWATKETLVKTKIKRSKATKRRNSAILTKLTKKRCVNKT